MDLRNLRLMGPVVLCALATSIAAAAQPADGEVAAAVAVARTIPMLNVNLNNFKYHGNPIFGGAPAGAWDERIERVIVFRVSADDWRMWYSARSAAGATAIGLATSRDGIHWTRHADNPVLEPSDPWEGRKVSITSVLLKDGLFYLYYWGPGHAVPPPLKRIGLAVSPDGVRWTKRGIVLDAEPAIHDESPDQGGSGVDAAKVFYLQEQRKWAMIFTAFGPYGQWNGLAESADGVQWTKVKAPIASMGGFHNLLAGHHSQNGQTIRCTVRVGSLWTALDYQLDGRTAGPAVAWSLDRWITLGPRTLSTNQEYESGQIAPVAIEAERDWYYIYYMMYGSGEVGLVRAPRHSVEQPMVLWSDAPATPSGITSMILEAAASPFYLFVASDVEGTAQLEAQAPGTSNWISASETRVAAAKVTRLPQAPSGASVRLKFASSTGQARVSAWAGSATH